MTRESGLPPPGVPVEALGAFTPASEPSAPSAASTALLDAAQRARLRAAIPIHLVSDADARRWRSVLVEEVDRLAAAKFPHEAVEMLTRSGAAYWSETILVVGAANIPSERWAYRMPTAKRLLPRTGFAHLFTREGESPTGAVLGAHIRVDYGHRVYGLYQSWRKAVEAYEAAVAETRAAFTLLIDTAETVAEVVEAWPEAAALLANEAGREERLRDAAARVRAVLGAAGEAAVSDNEPTEIDP